MWDVIKHIKEGWLIGEYQNEKRKKDAKEYLRNTYWKFPKFDVNIYNVHNQGVQNFQGLIYRKI